MNDITRRDIQTFRETFFLVFDCEIRSRGRGQTLQRVESGDIDSSDCTKGTPLFTHHFKINKRLHAHTSHKLKLNQTALQSIFKCTAHLPHSFDLLSSFFGVGRISYFSCVVLNCPLAQLRVTEMKTITHA